MSMVGYAVLIANPSAEFLAAERLRERGFKSYCPKRRVELTGHRPRRGESIFKPLFPRYLFAELHPDQEAKPMLWASGICSSATWALWQRGRPRRLLSCEFIEAMRIEENTGAFDARQPQLKHGEIVRITGGPFADLMGKIVAIEDDEKRIWVLLDVLGGTRVKCQRDTLEVVAS